MSDKEIAIIVKEGHRSSCSSTDLNRGFSRQEQKELLKENEHWLQGCTKNPKLPKKQECQITETKQINEATENSRK